MVDQLQLGLRFSHLAVMHSDTARLDYGSQSAIASCYPTLAFVGFAGVSIYKTDLSLSAAPVDSN